MTKVNGATTSAVEWQWTLKRVTQAEHTMILMKVAELLPRPEQSAHEST